MSTKFGDGQQNELVKWLGDHPNGFVWNETSKGAMLHKVRCSHIQTFASSQSGDNPKLKAGASENATKTCADAKEELLNEIPAAKDSANWCSHCNP